MVKTMELLMYRIKTLVLISGILLSLNSYSQPIHNRAGFVQNASHEEQWVDSVYHSLTPEERIAQLIMIRSYSGRNQHYMDSIAKVIARYNVGGVIFFKGSPHSQAAMTNYYQQSAKTPLFFAIDAEWGLGMRLDSTIAFPRQLALGAIEDDMLVYEMGLEIGRQLLRLGVHINFAPVVDVNNNAMNPVINSRSFGENNLFVASKSLAYMKGMQDMGIISVAKHFPGHGDTDKDSHYTLPLIRKPFHEIDSIHLFPFKYLIRNGLMGVMTAHLSVPSIDPHPKAISSLSSPIINGLLKEQLQFNGLVITDGLEMNAIADYVHPDSVEIKALQAGNDILILPVNTPGAIKNIRDAVLKGIISEKMIEEKCRKVLTYKYRSGLAFSTMVKTHNIYHDLNTPDAQLLNRRLIEASLTVAGNKDKLLPLMRPDTMKIAGVEIGNKNNAVFTERMKNYTPVDAFAIDKAALPEDFQQLENMVGNYPLVVVCVRGGSQNPKGNYRIGRQVLDFVKSLSGKTRVVLLLAGNPYSLSLFEPFDDLGAVMVAYHDNDLTVDLAAQAIFGAFNVSGELPVTVAPDMKSGSGERLEELHRLKYTIPEEVGISADWLQKADSIAWAGIDTLAYPGCRVLAAIDGKVIYDKNFGHHTYEKEQEVRYNDIYDLASLTKIAATTPAVMHLYQHGLIDIDQKISKYIPDLQNSNKKNIIIRDLLTHQARLQAWIPFYRTTLIDGKPNPTIYSNRYSADYNISVARDLYMNKNYLQKIFDSINASPLLKKQQYLYSDLGFYWLKEMIEQVAEMPLDEFMHTYFYKPLGFSSTVFNAYRYFDAGLIVPTEYDTVFRKQLLHGYVHDPGAAMFDGIGGHAGLFSTAGELAVFMQMLMNNGYYGGTQFFAPHVLAEFTRTQYPLNDNRRGLGFDKPQLEREINGPTNLYVSEKSFGHSGFTGTYAWADPEHKLVYIFLSNRVHPSASNNNLGRLNIRTAIHEVFYNAIRKRDESGIFITR
jgi:beta-N-acetylhexosaminidase